MTGGLFFIPSVDFFSLRMAIANDALISIALSEKHL